MYACGTRVAHYHNLHVQHIATNFGVVVLVYGNPIKVAYRVWHILSVNLRGRETISARMYFIVPSNFKFDFKIC